MRESDYEKIGDHIQTSIALSDYDRIISPAATQRIDRWDSFDGLRQASPSGSVTIERYQIVDGFFVNDTTTGKNAFSTDTSTAAGATGYIALRGDVVAGPITGGHAVRSAENWWFKVLLAQSVAPVGGTQEYLVGYLEALPGGTQVDGFYFRRVNTSNWFLVCRNAGVESTLDMGVDATTTVILLEFRFSLDGGAVDGYYNNRRVGRITTNIPTNLQSGPFILHHNRAATVTTAGKLRCYGWGWKGDLVA